MNKIVTDVVVDSKPKDIFIADFFREEIISGRLKKGDKLLSDEKIARQFKLNKRTVASGLNILVGEGLLSRAPRRGTIVIMDYSNRENGGEDKGKGSENDALREDASLLPHDIDYLFFIAETKVLTFISFENFPAQQKMWKYLIEKFNSKSKGRKVELESVPLTKFNSNGIELCKYLKAKSITPDIIQSVILNTSPSILQDLPEDLAAYASGEESLSENVLPDFKPLLNKIVPVYTSVPVCVWNQEMEDASGIKSFKSDIIRGNLVETLCNAVPDFPNGLAKIGPHLSCLLRHHGLPFRVADVNVEYFMSFFDEIFKGLALLKKSEYPKAFIENCTQYKSYDNFSRKKHFLIQTLSTPPHYPDKEYLEFKLGTTIYPPKNDLLMELSSLGVGKDSPEPEFASDFIRFVTSHESQLFIHSSINAIPYRKSALDALPQINPQMTPPELDIIRNNIKFGYYPWHTHFTAEVISIGMVELFEGIVSGKIDSSRMAAEIAYKIFKESLIK
jgi:hypothetical protein